MKRVGGPVLQRPDRVALAAILLLALLLRLRVGLHTTYIIHPDETYDYLEQGFRLAFGYGYKTWTYQYGIRSYAFAGLIAAIIRLASFVSGHPDTQLDAVATVMSVLSLGIVATAFLWGFRVAGRAGAAITGALAAVWFELVYFAPHTISEVIAADALVLGVYLTEDFGGLGLSRRRSFAAGLCLGLTFVFRVQLAPALAVVGLWLIWRQGWRGCLRVVGAALIPVVAGGMLDWWTYDYPFQSTILNVWANTAGGVSAYYGRRPFYYFLDIELSYLNGAIAILALAACLGARRLPRLALIAVAIIGLHSVIGWKEYRFIYPALPFVIVLAGLGTAEAVAMVRAARPGLWPAIPVAVAIGFWSLTSAALALEGPFRREWVRRSGQIEAARAVAALPEVCGIAAYGFSVSALAGHVRLRHDVPIYEISRPEHFPSDARSVDVVIAPDDGLPPEGALADAGFAPRGCWSDGWNDGSFNQRLPKVCVLVRPGPCAAGIEGDPDRNRPPGW